MFSLCFCCYYELLNALFNFFQFISTSTNKRNLKAINFKSTYLVMKRTLWGKFLTQPDEASREKQVEIDKEIMMEKRGKNLNFRQSFISNII